jgi:glycosyltransferase involved in cell wall biosynthesis
MKRPVRSTVARHVRRFLASRICRPFVRPLASGFRRKRISVMMRIKNEATFLRASVESILPMVDEIVIIDNDSTDATPRIAQDLARSHPEKMRICQYHHAIARVGSENQALAASITARNSPRLLANYYNWCMRQCRMNYILKWDGDMVATPSLAVNIEHFRYSRDLIMWMFGANLHPDRRHLVSASRGTQRKIQMVSELRDAVTNHISPYTDSEPRLFPRLLAEYRTDFWWCESLSTPWWQWSVSMKECGFLHLKYCKPDPYEHWSYDFAALIKRGIVPGPTVPVELRSLVEFIGTGTSQ